MPSGPIDDVCLHLASRVSQSPFRAPSSNQDEACPLNLTLGRRFFDSGPKVLRQADDSANCQNSHCEPTGRRNDERKSLILLIATASSCRCRPTCMARPGSACRTLARPADCCVVAPVWSEPRRAVSARAPAVFPPAYAQLWCWELRSFWF